MPSHKTGREAVNAQVNNKTNRRLTVRWLGGVVLDGPRIVVVVVDGGAGRVGGGGGGGEGGCFCRSALVLTLVGTPTICTATVVSATIKYGRHLLLLLLFSDSSGTSSILSGCRRGIVARPEQPPTGHQAGRQGHTKEPKQTRFNALNAVSGGHQNW